MQKGNTVICTLADGATKRGVIVSDEVSGGYIVALESAAAARPVFYFASEFLAAA